LLESIAKPAEIGETEEGEERFEKKIEIVVWKEIGELPTSSQETVGHSRMMLC